MILDMDEVKTDKHLIAVIKFFCKRMGYSRYRLLSAVDRLWGDEEHLNAPSSIPLSYHQRTGLKEEGTFTKDFIEDGD